MDQHPETTRDLSEFRFAPTKGSFEKIRRVKQYLEEIRREIPEVEGIAFFGSRTRGQERLDSDLDVIIFFNPATNNAAAEDEDMENRVRKIEKRIQEKLIAIFETLNIPINRDTPAETIQPVDISPSATMQKMNYFERQVDRMAQKGRSLRGTQVSREAFDLASRFFLSTGKSVYENRKFILDNWFSRGEKGERYYKALRDTLVMIEREMPTISPPDYKHYPNTIAEAKEYFFLR